MSKNKTQLQAPGAGLPAIEHFIAKHITLPLKVRPMVAQKAVSRLIAIGEETIKLAQSVPPDQAARPTLIKRVRGIEDSSRNWSIIMTIDHLLITGRAIQNITELLATGTKPDIIVRIEDVKPIPAQSPDNIIKDYQIFLGQYEDSIDKIDHIKTATQTIDHPWFGPLTAGDWLNFNAAHHEIHLKQVRGIIRELGRE